MRLVLQVSPVSFPALLVGLSFWNYAFSSSSALAVSANPQSLPVAEISSVVQEEVASPRTSLPETSEKNSQDGKQTAASRIADLMDTIEEDRKQLAKLDFELDDPESEYGMAERAFHELNNDIEKLGETLDAAKKAQTTAEVERLTRELESLDRQRKLAQDRFDLAIESRQTLRDEIRTLKSKLKKDQGALDELTDGKPEEEPSDESPTQKSDRTKDRSDEASGTNSDKSDEADSEGNGSKTKAVEEAEASEEDDAVLMEAKAIAQEKEEDAREAAVESQSIAARMSDIQKLVNQEQKELTLIRKRADLASAEQISLTEEIARRRTENATPMELTDLHSAASDANQRLIKTRSQISEISDRLNDHRAELASMQAEHIVALHETKLKQDEAANAEDQVQALRNPFAPRNILQWLLDHGIRLLGIVVGMFLVNRIASFFAHRSVSLISTGGGRGTKLERENRARTLVGVFQNAATVAIFVTGIMMLLEEVGANITVLMGGVAVIGLAVAFGAQNLIKDYFYGFVMLLENQYMLNDSIQIGSVSGQVERITLRMTVLRDANGVVHFIPNGTINSVSNETHGWSRAVCEISVCYEESLERVTAILNQIASELRSDPAFGPLLLEDPKTPAIGTLGESAITLKTSVKTLPNKHGTVKQEWLRRIQAGFAQHGVSPAYPLQRLTLNANDAVHSNGAINSILHNGLRRTA